MDIPGYRVLDEVVRTGPFAVHRGVRLADGRAVLLKIPTGVPPRPAEAEALEREFALLSRIALTGVPQVHDFVRTPHSACLVLEDAGLDPLALRIPTKTPDLRAVLAIAIRLCTLLRDLHAQRITCGSLSPSSVLTSDPDREDGSLALQLVDFSLASRWPRDGSAVGRAAWSASPYISPEQTGRMNRSIDHRTDFYSLGATLYELLAGRPPFASDDPLELMHAHLARTPPPPSSVRPGVPEPLERLVRRLLAKASEDRYQSAAGILADLERCERDWRTSGAIAPFEPGEYDVPDRFLVPQRLYGREAETAAVIAAFGETRRGRALLLLVSGYAGIGKTSLISAVHRPVLESRGYFTTGKFDQVLREIPYGALVQALRHLIRQWLAEPEGQLQARRAQLAQALGVNVGVLAEMIPEIELLLGRQPRPAPLDAVETQNRFRYVFQGFLGAAASPAHPLVLFLDDLQWVDAATIELLASALTSGDVHHLLVIGAYRDDDVDSGHLLPWAIERLQASQAPIRRIRLESLALADVTAFLRDTLHAGGSEVEELGALVLRRTGGNPFFVIQFLAALGRDGQFVFDAQRRGWTFRLDRIAAAGFTENVIDLMTRRIRSLPPRAQSALMVAACIGSRFDEDTYLTASRLPGEEASAGLADAIEAGLIQEIDAAPHAPDPEAARVYAFLHDRVQQAAYELIPAADRPAMHRDVGRLLLARYGGEVPEDRVFEVVGHLNIGEAAAGTPAERRALARLNLAAGRKAKTATAYQAAASYFDAGLESLTEEHWSSEREVMFALHLEGAECHYLAGAFDVAERRFAELLARARSPIEAAEVHSLRIVLYENQSRFAEALASGREGLALFGLAFPGDEESTDAALDREIAAIDARLGNRPIASIADLPVMQQADARMLMRLLTALWAPSYLSGRQRLTRLISATMVRLSLVHGNAEDSAYGYVTHAITVGPVRGDYASAYEWGALALAVNERFDDAKRRAKIQQQFHAHVKLWRHPFHTCLPHAREARRSALEHGDFTYAGYAAVSESWPAMLVCPTLDGFVRDFVPALTLLDRIRMPDFRAALRVMVNWALALQGRTSGPTSLSDAHFDEEVFARTYERAAPFFLTFSCTARLSLCVLHARYVEALELARRAREVTVAGTIWPVLIDFWESLAIAGAWADADEAVRQNFLWRLGEAEARLAALAASCPENFRSYAALVAAARRRVDGRQDEARACCDEAIAAAREHDHVQMLALAHEAAAAVAAEAGDRGRAAACLQEARRQYLRWGALAKVRQLERASPVFAGTAGEPVDLQPAAAPDRDSAALDMATVLKAAQAISVEIETEGLLRKLMHLVLENAGAQRAVFLRLREDALVIEADARADPPAVRLDEIPCGEQSDLALGVIRYVRRTGQDVVLTDAAADARFSIDPYVARTRARSVACAPVEHQGRLAGLLYLENNLTTAAFTAERTAMLRILAAQAAISLENARLYEDMKAEVARRTAAEGSLREALAELQVLQQRLEAENVYLQEEIRIQHNFNEIVGNSPPLLEALRRVELVAPMETTVLVLGETGSGKELFARAIHTRSRRHQRPLVKVNCGAIAPGLVESELFGHVKGAFTGAIDKRIGRFEVANGGTIFLDEIGELPLEAQVKLLRVLQEQEFEPVGSSRTVKVDVRVIAATNRDLERAVREGAFRADLLYRLNVFPIEVPPLRARRSDIPLLAGLFVASLSRRLGKPLQGFSARSMERLMAYSWPGNVRELQNLVERAAIVATGPVLDVDRAFGVEPAGAAAAASPRGSDTLDSVQRAHILAVLQATDGVVEGARGAASILGLHPNTLRSRMKKLGIAGPRRLQGT